MLLTSRLYLNKNTTVHLNSALTVFLYDLKVVLTALFLRDATGKRDSWYERVITDGRDGINTVNKDKLASLN